MGIDAIVVVEFTQNGALEEAVPLQLKSLGVNSKLGNELIVGLGRPTMLAAVTVGVGIMQRTVE